MRHRVFGRKLNRDVKERKALFRSLIAGLITHGKIKTTITRARTITSLAEKLVTHARENSRSSIVQVSSFLNKKEIIDKLTRDIAPRFGNKIGGYLRMIRLGRRAGDNAEEVFLEWSLPGKDLKIPKKNNAIETKPSSKSTTDTNQK